MNANNSLINPHNTFPESASQHSPQVKEVVAVIFPFLTDAPSQEHPFRLNDIVKTGNQYGTVTSLNKTEKPVTITWDATSGEDSFSWNYNLDEISAIQISLIPQLIPQKTAGELPACTTIVLANSEQIQFSNATGFKVESLTQHHILISTLDQYYLFLINLFPGFPTSCTIDIPAPQQLKADRSLSVTDLKIRAKTYLALEIPDNFLEFAIPIQKQQFKEKLARRLSEEDYEIFDFNIAWEETWKQHLENLAKKQGLYGFKEGDCIFKCREGVQQRGTVQRLSVENIRPFQIQWNSGEIQSYSLTELKSLGIARIEAIVKLSPNVAYQISEDGSYFRAWIGFRTKALAKAWLLPIKKLVGCLSNLIDCQVPDIQQHTGSKYEYAVECPRHKTLKKRLEALAKVAELDLGRMPFRR